MMRHSRRVLDALVSEVKGIAQTTISTQNVIGAGIGKTLQEMTT